MIILCKIVFFSFIYFALADITSPVNYQPVKYSQIRMEINYAINNGFVKKELEVAHQNILVTLINSKKPVYVSGRLLVVKSNNPDSSIKGSDVKSMSNNNGACSPISTFSETQWIALVLKGGQCSIKDKLDNVLLRSNASAVIIFDNSLQRNVDKYEFNNEIGLLVTEFMVPMNILLNDTIYINASISVSNYYTDGIISRTSVLFVSISFILLMVISLVWLIFYYIQRFRYMHAKERLSRRLANAAKKALDKIPLKILSAYDNEVSNDYDQCAICIDSYKIGETIRILPCKHIFHKICIDSWLIEQRSCPMCKVDILKACGVLNVSDSGKTQDRVVSSLINQGLWVRGATVTATAALLEAGMNGEALAIDTLGSYPNSRCNRGHSTFLQRYRERYGLYHCHRGHRRDHFHKLSRNFHEHRCISLKNKSILSKVDLHPNDKVFDNNQMGPEHIDLISESEPSIISQQDTSLCISIPEDKDPKYVSGITSKQQDLHEISNSIVYDICECSSHEATVECDVCESRQNDSTKASTACSCESCSDCVYTDTDCDHYNVRRNNHSFGNLLKCCVTSDSNISTLQNDSMIGICGCNPCVRCHSSTCSSCYNKASPVCKNCSSKSCHVKMDNSHFNSYLKALQYNQANVATVCLRPSSQNRQTDNGHYENIERMKSMMLIKNINKSGTLDSYTKSSISDDFDYEADNGSSSLEITVPAVKLTVLPPQVQCHHGPDNIDSSQPTPLKLHPANDDEKKSQEGGQYSENSL